MDALLNTLATLFADTGTQNWAFAVLAGAAITVFALGLSFVFLGATDPIRRRLGLPDGKKDPTGHLLVHVETLVGPVSQWVLPKSEMERSETTRLLTYAGFRAPNTLQSYYGIKALLAILLPALVLLGTRWFPNLASSSIVFYCLCAAAIGVFGSSLVLEHLVKKRHKALRNAFPDALDLLVVCVESGLGLAAAIQRVSEELAVSHPELAMELALVNAEMRAGVTRARALKNLADRTGLDDIRGLVGLLTQTIRFGTSVADALRVYSEEFRDKRMQKAEEQAAKIGTKLIFPLVLCLFPSFFTVAIGPAVIRLIDVFSQL